MSYCRWSPHSDVYVFGTTDDRYECCTCSLLADDRGEGFCVRTALEMIAHLEAHRAQGDLVPHYALEGLAIDAHSEALTAAGYVRQRSRWALPHQLGLTRKAGTAARYVGSQWDAEKPDNYHCVPQSETWVVAWAERIAQLPIPIAERRLALRTG